MRLKKNYREFQKIIKERKITELIHFTPTKNLLSILEQGEIMSRARLESLGIEYIQFNDKIRYDDKNYINLSLSGPNTFLLKKYKKRYENDPTITWCILKVDPKHIYEYDTLFSVTNAARRLNISGDLEKFKQLFLPEIKYGTRVIKRGNIKDKYPTDEQAEILVKDSIPLSSIMKVCFYNEEDLACTRAAIAMSTIQKTTSLDSIISNFIIDPEIFNPNRGL